MKIIIHLYLNENCTEISSTEIQIESNEMKVKELKKMISEIYQLNPSDQILTIKFLGIKVITLSDDYPLSFFYIRKNSEIYLDTIKKYKNKNPSEISQINSRQNIIISNIFDEHKEKIINKNIFSNDKMNQIKQDTIFESIEENSDDEIEIKNKEKINNNINIPIRETNPDFVIKNALLLIRDNKFIEFINYLESNKIILGNVQKIINKKNNWNALHYSCFYGNKDITAYLLSYNNSNNSIHDLINSLTKENYTPLHIACYKCNESIVKILLLYLRDIEINTVNKNNETAIHIACKKNSMKIVSMLIASNANLFLKDKNDKKPIELTTDNNIKKLLVKSMIKSPNFKNEDLNNINSDISLYQKNYFTPPKPPKIIGFLEKRGQFIPFYTTIFVEIDPVSGYLKKFKGNNNYPKDHFEMIMLNNISLCKKENSDSSEDYYFSIISQKSEIYRVKNRNARDKWIQCINESVVYYKYWKKFQKKNQNIEDYLKMQKNYVEFVDYKNGEIRKIGGSDETEKKSRDNKKKRGSKMNYMYNDVHKNNSVNSNNIFNQNIVYSNKIDFTKANTVNNNTIKINNSLHNAESIYMPKTNNIMQNIPLSKANTLENCKIKEIKMNIKQDNINGNKFEENKMNINQNYNRGIRFEDYIIICLLGTGSFGRVFKVKIKDDTSQKIYAMKVINKNLLIRKKQLKYAVGECSVLKKCDCPFIVKLYYSFQTLENLYMVEEYCPGGDLQYHLKINLLEEEEAKFYISELILAIEHLHDLNIIYRDLKPENILIGEDNHIILADFGLAKEGIQGNSLSQSFCGSPAYLPPETLNMKGVGKSGDIYGIGAVLYEMISGTPPFFSNEIAVLFNKIKNCQLVLHQYFSEDLKDLLKKLLDKDPDKRFGVNDKEEIKEHPFFKGIDWEKLEKKEITPPINFIKQKNDNEKGGNDKKSKLKKNIRFNDVDYNEQNKYTKRVKNFTFIRETKDDY